MKATPAFSSFILFEGEKNITIEKDTKVPKRSSFYCKQRRSYSWQYAENAIT